MAKERDVKCNKCGHIWLSQAKPDNLKCKKCGFADVEDNYVDPDAISEALITEAEAAGVEAEQIVACATAEELRVAIAEARRPVPPETIHVEASGRTLVLPGLLYLRATEQVGMTDEQIVMFPDAESVENHCDSVLPEAAAMVHIESGRNTLDVPKDLYTRCTKKIGMSDAQIASYESAEALEQAANGMHPRSNPDTRIKEGSPPKNVVFEEDRPDSFTLESVLEAKFIKTNRDHYDRATLQAFLRRIDRRYGPAQPVRIVQDRSFVVVKRELVTHYTIYYK